MKRRLSKFEDWWINSRNFRLAKHSFRPGRRVPTIKPYASFASSSKMYVQLRVVLEKPRLKPEILRRGLPTLFAKQAPSARVEVILPDQSVIELVTDRGGYITQQVLCNLEPGWQTLQVRVKGNYTIKKHKKERSFPTSEECVALKVYVVGDEQTTGVISDIDDTILVSNAPRPLVAVKNMALVSPHKRKHVQGMPSFYNKLSGFFPNSFLIYLSAGPWNQYSFLKRFIASHKFPFAPIILQDIGPDVDKIFESTKTHKAKYLNMLFNMFPNVKWVLIGDDGQHDLNLYRQIALDRPKNVRAILIRQLTAPEHLLINALPMPVHNTTTTEVVPIFYASNGDALSTLLDRFIHPGL